uniref:Myb-like domain-containing protein n=1 Tax=Aegilops tauschii subsp. strangulata TaxID=200361 RepID=A0A453QZQ1_AEGTS
MDVDDDVEDDDMDFNPLYREGSPSETSSSLTSEAECEGTSFQNQPSTEVLLRNSPGNGNAGDCVLPKESLSAKGACKENVPESSSTQLHCENGEGRVNGLGKKPLQTVASFSPPVQNTHPLLHEGTEEDAICRRTRARYSLANYALDELETFLQESDDDGDLQNVDEEEEYRKFLSAVLSGGGDGTQACQGDETQDEDENDADFELEIEEALESDGGENVENDKNINGKNKKDGHRPQTRKKRPELSRAVNHQQESTKPNLRPIVPNFSPTPQVPGQYPSQNINVPSSSSSATGAAVVKGFTDEQLGQLHILIYEHVQLMIQTFSLCVLDPSKQRVAADVKKMIVELVGYRDQALARKNTIRQQFYFEGQHLRSAISHASSESSQCQWIPLIKNPVMSILDVSPLHLALSYLSDVAGASPGQSQPKKSLAATLFESTKKESVALVPFDIARLAQRFYPLFNFSLFPHKPPPAAMVSRLLFTDAEDGLLALGLLEYNNDWEAIQKRFLPCKSTHQIFVRQKNRSSAKATDNPVKDVRRMKNSPLTSEEVQRIEEGLKIFKHDWTSIWKFVVPYRDPSLLQRQWRVANGVQRSYSKSEALKAKRRTYEAKRRQLKASMADSQVGREQETDTPVNANTIDFHPLLQRPEAEMHVEVPEEDCHPLSNQSDGRIREPPVDDQSTVREASTSERENGFGHSFVFLSGFQDCKGFEKYS